MHRRGEPEAHTVGVECHLGDALWSGIVGELYAHIEQSVSCQP